MGSFREGMRERRREEEGWAERGRAAISRLRRKKDSKVVRIRRPLPEVPARAVRPSL